MEHPYQTPFTLLLLVFLAVSASACFSPGRDWVPDGDGGTIIGDPSCPEANFIVPETTCGSAQPDRVCAGSCAQTLDGIVGVGLSSCRCMDTGSGFGAQWVCDTSACDDGGGPSDAGTDTSTVAAPDSSASPDADVCAPVRFDPPSEPGCSTSQLYEIMRFETQADYDAFVADSTNDTCNACMTMSALACGTALGCDGMAGDLMCCLDDNCGDDEACRDEAFRGVCAAQVNEFSICVSSVSACALNPLAPPAECFP